MYTKIQVVFDAADPEKLAEFWGLALGYVAEPPPEGFGTWEEFARSAGIAEAEFGDQASRIDPAGEGPRLYFQRVPEGKTAKNRVHLDVHVAGREVRAVAGPPCRVLLIQNWGSSARALRRGAPNRNRLPQRVASRPPYHPAR